MDAISATKRPVTPPPTAFRADPPVDPCRSPRRGSRTALGLLMLLPSLLMACLYSPDVERVSTRDATRRPGERPVPPETPVPPDATAPTTSTESRMLSPLTWGETAQLLVGRDFDPIHFDPMSYELTNAGRRQAGEYANWLRGHPHVWLVLTGHTDAIPCDEFALNLGMARATAIGEFMISRGIEGKRLFALSFGADRPLYDTENAEAQRLNNRVEVQGFVAPESGEIPGMVSVFGPLPPGPPEVVLPPPSIPMENETNF